MRVHVSRNPAPVPRRKARLAVGASLVALALTVSACGGSDDDGGGGDGDGAVGEVATYTGADRATKLLAGAKKEGALNLYTNPTGDITNAMVAAFEKKYPDVKVKVTQGDSSDLARRVAEEASAGRGQVDVVETTAGALGVLQSSDLLTPFKSPETANYAKESVTDHLVTVRESYLGLGYNTKRVPPAEVPKTLDDLLNPKWRGEISIPTSATGIRWVAALELIKGKDYVKKMAAQKIKGQNISGRALADFVVSGELAMSPTIYNSHVSVSSAKGAPIAWQPIEPVIAVPTAVVLAKEAPHPNAAMLYIDFALSKQGQAIYKSKGYDSARTDMPDGKDFKKIYIDTRDDYSEKYPQWEQSMRTMLGQ